MAPISQIADEALREITKGTYPELPLLAITGLLNDFQYVWLKRFKIKYKFDVLDLARMICNGENKAVFKATKCRSVQAIRKKFSDYINKWHNNDDRVILKLSYDGKKINSEWVDLEHY